MMIFQILIFCFANISFLFFNIVRLRLQLGSVINSSEGNSLTVSVNNIFVKCTIVFLVFTSYTVITRGRSSSFRVYVSIRCKSNIMYFTHDYLGVKYNSFLAIFSFVILMALGHIISKVSSLSENASGKESIIERIFRNAINSFQFVSAVKQLQFIWISSIFSGYLCLQ